MTIPQLAKPDTSADHDIDFETVVDRVTGRLLTTCGPLSKQEIVTLTGMSGSQIEHFSKTFDSPYEWLVVLSAKTWLKRNDDAQVEMSSVKELNEALMTEAGRYRFLVIYKLMLLCGALPIFIHDQPRFSQEIGQHLMVQRHVGRMLEGVEKSEALVQFAKHTSMLMVSLSIDYWEMLLNDPNSKFPFTLQEFNDYVASA